MILWAVEADSNQRLTHAGRINTAGDNPGLRDFTTAGPIPDACFEYGDGLSRASLQMYLRWGLGFCHGTRAFCTNIIKV